MSIWVVLHLKAVNIWCSTKSCTTKQAHLPSHATPCKYIHTNTYKYTYIYTNTCKYIFTNTVFGAAASLTSIKHQGPSHFRRSFTSTNKPGGKWVRWPDSVMCSYIYITSRPSIYQRTWRDDKGLEGWITSAQWKGRTLPTGSASHLRGAIKIGSSWREVEMRRGRFSLHNSRQCSIHRETTKETKANANSF